MAQQLSDPGSSGGGGARPIAQYSTKRKDAVDVNGTETTVIWDAKLFEIGGIENYVELCGKGGGEWIKFKQSGYYRIDLLVNIRLTKNAFAWIRVKDENLNKIKSIGVVGKINSGYPSGSASFVQKANKGEQLCITYEHSQLNTSGTLNLNSLTIEKVG